MRNRLIYNVRIIKSVEPRSFITLTIDNKNYKQLKYKPLSKFVREFFNRINNNYRFHNPAFYRKLEYMWRVERGENPGQDSDPLGRLHVHIICDREYDYNYKIQKFWSLGRVDCMSLLYKYKRNTKGKLKMEVHNGILRKVKESKLNDKEQNKKIVNYISKYTSKVQKGQLSMKKVYMKYCNISGRQYSGSRAFQKLPEGHKLWYDPKTETWSLKSKQLGWICTENTKIRNYDEYLTILTEKNLDFWYLESKTDIIARSVLYNFKNKFNIKFIYVDGSEIRREINHFYLKGKRRKIMAVDFKTMDDGKTWLVINFDKKSKKTKKYMNLYVSSYEYLSLLSFCKECLSV